MRTDRVDLHFLKRGIKHAKLHEDSLEKEGNTNVSTALLEFKTREYTKIKFIFKSTR